MCLEEAGSTLVGGGSHLPHQEVKSAEQHRKRQMWGEGQRGSGWRVGLWSQSAFSGAEPEAPCCWQLAEAGKGSRELLDH